MDIVIQFKTIIFSFFYGVVFSLFLGFNYKFMINNGVFSFIFSLFFSIVCVLVYFIFLKKINFGFFHPYEIFCIIFGFFTEILIYHLVYKKLKK